MRFQEDGMDVGRFSQSSENDFAGKTFTYAADASVIDVAAMFGFIQNQCGNVAIANRIFETRLYNVYLSEDEMQKTDI